MKVRIRQGSGVRVNHSQGALLALLVACLAIAPPVAIGVAAAPVALSGSDVSAVDFLPDLPDVAQPTVSDPISAAELEDLNTIADQNGISLEAAMDRYAWNDNFSLAVHMVRESFPEAFASAEILDADDARVAFASDAPEGALELIVAFSRAYPGISVEIREDVGYSEWALEEAIEDVHYAVLDSPGVLEAATSFEKESRTISTTVTLTDDVSSLTVNELSAIASKSIASTRSDGGAPFATDVHVSQRPVLGGDDSSSYHHGGESLSTCTSGFGVRTSSATSGTRGISTAGHCGDAQSDDGYSLSLEDEYRGTHGDFQWHTGPNPESDDFYSGDSLSTEVNRRDVSALGFPSVGQSLCKNGKTNKKSCQEVRKLDVCLNGDCHLVQMGARLAAGGDSGGPIYWGTTAYGLHKGWHYDPSWPNDRDLFSRGSRIDDALGVWIATN